MNNQYLFRCGTVQEKCNIYNATSTIVHTYMDSERIPNTVQIITLREAALDEARDEAVSVSKRIDELSPLMYHLANTKYNMQREFIRVEQDSIIVALDVPAITENAITTGMMMLTEIEDFDTYNTYHFGQCVDTSQPLIAVDTKKKM